MADETEAEELHIPLAREDLAVSKHVVETGRLKVRTEVEERTEVVRQTLARENVEVKRVAVGRIVDRVPEVREEDDAIVIPVTEEVLVVSKQLRLVEELHVRRIRTTEEVEQPAQLRSTRAVVERGGGEPD